jgi:hypothetical protein
MVYAHAGWHGVSMLGAAFSAAAMLIWAGARQLSVGSEATECANGP